MAEKKTKPLDECHSRTSVRSQWPEAIRLLHKIVRKLERIIVNQAELAQALNDKSAQLQKAFDELVAAIGNAGNVTPEVQTALDNLGIKTQAIDDIVPDQP